MYNANTVPANFNSNPRRENLQRYALCQPAPKEGLKWAND